LDCKLHEVNNNVLSSIIHTDETSKKIATFVEIIEIGNPFLKHADLVSCNELVFEMSATPTDWGE